MDESKTDAPLIGSTIDAILFQKDESDPGYFEEDDDDLKNLDLTLSSVSPETPPRGRTVKFSGIDDATLSPIRPMELASHAELLSKLDKLHQKLTQTQIDLSSEKALRKRKEKNLLKLAKQLNKRAAESDFKDGQINKLAQTVNELESTASSHHQEITAAQQKYRDICREHDAQLQQAQKRHEETTAALRQEILQANLEADRLRAKLAATEMKMHPEAAEKIVEQTLKSSLSSSTRPKKMKRHVVDLVRLVLMVVRLLLVVAAVVVVSAAFRKSETILDVVCSPAMPGTRLVKEQVATFDAPWCVPDSFKERAFAVCGDRIRTRLMWLNGKLTAYNLHETDVKHLWSRRSHVVEIGVEKIALESKSGTIVEEIAPWSQ